MDDQEIIRHRTDVLVNGGGLAGCMAAIRAAEADGVEYMRFALPLEPHLMAADGFHPSAAAYAIWARLAAERIRAR